LALQRVIRGENLEDTNPDAANAYKQFMANADKTAEAYERDKARFIISSLDEALQLTDKQKARLNEVTGQRYKEIKKKVRTNTNQKKLWMQDQIKNGPKVEVYVEPKLQMGRVGDAQTIQMEGIVIGLNGVRLYFPPGKNMMHPLFAERYAQIKKSKEEALRRKAVLQGTIGSDVNWRPGQPDGWSTVAQEMNKINKEYGSSSGSGEQGDRWDTPDLGGNF